MDGTDAEILKLWDDGIAWLKDAGAEVVDISLPHTKYALPAYYIVAPAEASSNLARYDGVRYGLRDLPDGAGLQDMYAATRAAGFGDEVKRRILIGTYVLSAGFYDAYYTQAMKVRTLISRDFDEAFAKCDVILAPTTPTASFALGDKIDDPLAMYLNDVFSVPASMAGLPAMSVPAALNKDGLAARPADHRQGVRRTGRARRGPRDRAARRVYRAGGEVVVTHPGAAAQAPGRYVALDSLRGLAALGIVFYHMGDFGWIAGLRPFRSGWMLVDFFFVLSGFVITASYGARLAHGYPRVPFLLVRLGRVYPLHIAMVGVFVALEFLVFRPVLHEPHPLSELARGVFLLDAFARGAGNFYAPVSWAVAVEVVLYALAAALYGRGRWAMALAALAALGAALALYSGFNVLVFGRLLQRGLLGFPLGALCFALHGKLITRQPGGAVLTIAEIAVTALFVWLIVQPGKTASWIPAAALLYGAMVLVFARDGGIVSRVLAARPFVMLGQLSFAIYMVHITYIIVSNRFLPRLFAAMGHGDWISPGSHRFGLLSIDPPPLVATAITLAILALVLPTAWLAWRFIEEPARGWTRRFAPPAVAAPVAAI